MYNLQVHGCLIESVVAEVENMSSACRLRNPSAYRKNTDDEFVCGDKLTRRDAAVKDMH